MPRFRDGEPFVPEYIFAVDPSMTSPGFALLKVNGKRVSVVKTASCDNSKKKDGPGKKLAAIAHTCRLVAGAIPQGANVIFVRERVFTRFNKATQVLAKVSGVLDYILVKELIQGHRGPTVNSFDWVEITPKEIKALVAGSGSATKQDVQRALADWVGVRKYGNTDESDAVAVGITYLSVNNLARPRVKREGYVPPGARGVEGAREEEPA